MTTLTYQAPCHFGLESILAGELKRLGADNVRAENGKVIFEGGFDLMARANICLRTAERVLIQLAVFPATTFEELFQGVKQIPLEDFIGKKDAFPVKGWSLNSKLESVPSCQSIIKKAAVERLKDHYGVEWFVETGPLHQLQFSIHKDEATILLDTSGVGLHKRGYRANANEAPIKETLAAGIVDLAHVKPFSTVHDPLCGSGTLLIEAAMKALNIPPCLRRKFAAQEWGLFSPSVWQDERARGLENVNKNAEFFGYGSDLDPQAVELTKENAQKAGVSGRLSIQQADIRRFRAEEGKTVLCNPPYGERLLEKSQAEELYQIMGKRFLALPKASYYIISPHNEFEKLFGRRADKRRKLYNGMIPCQVFQYFK